MQLGIYYARVSPTTFCIDPFYTKQGNIWDVRYLANGALVKDEAAFGNVRLIRVGGKLKIDDGVTGSGSGSGSGSSGGVAIKMKIKDSGGV